MDVTVLAVDDSPVFRAALGEIVQAADGFRVVGEAATGDEAVRLARELRPQLVLVDDRLGSEDGAVVAEQIRALDLPLAVVLMTAGDIGPLRERTRGSGVDGVVEKRALRPAALAQLWEESGSLMRARHPDACDPR